MDDSTKNLWDIAISGAQLATVILAAFWAFFRFRRERIHQPRIEFRIDCHFHGPQAGNYLVDFVLTARNNGLVVHRFKSIKLRVRGIQKTHPLKHWDQCPPRAHFPDKLVDDAEVLYSPKYDHIFVEPGVEQVITYSTLIPDNESIIVARVEFHYDKEGLWPHSAERVFSAPLPPVHSASH